MDVGGSIRQFRRSGGLTQAELGARLGVSDKTVSSWEINRTEPNMGQIQKMAQIFNCKNSDIIDGRGMPDLAGRRRFIPVLGRVRAGIPMEAMENIIDYEEISEEMARGGEFFGLQVKGNSMEPRFLEGDIVIVRKQSDIESGDIGIVIIDGCDATLKKIVKHEKGLSLIALNQAYEPKFYTPDEVKSIPIEIIGKVVELRGKY